MIYLFVPHYNPINKYFFDCLSNQTAAYRVVYRSRKRDKIYWTKAVNDFRRELMRYRGIKPDDVVCVMNDDVKFPANLFEKGSKVKQGEVLIPLYYGVNIDWKRKAFYHKLPPVISMFYDTFPGRCFFITVKDFIENPLSRLLPHYLSDYDYGIRLKKKGFKIKEINVPIHHQDHPKPYDKRFSILNPANPLFWTIFLLKHPNIYTPINIIKAWIK